MNTVLFDLDGTLLPMDMDLFTRAYLREIGRKGAFLGWEASRLVEIIMAGFAAMVANDGSKTNEEVFWNFFSGTFSGKRETHVRKFERFYSEEFAKLAEVVNPTPLANQYVQILKEKGYELVLATNPIFPKVATLERMRWAGLVREDFSLITTYENSRYTKPNLEYYQEILDTIKAAPKNCLMIGNDVQEDLCAAELGMDVFLVTDDLINRNDQDISHFRKGDRHELLAFLNELPSVV